MSTMTTVSEADLLSIDLFAGDKDSPTIRARTNRMVSTRKPHTCLFSCAPGSSQHEIAIGSRARVERAVVDGVWCTLYVCCDCLTKWIEEEC